MGRAVSKAETVRTNLLAPAALTLALLPALRRHDSPRVVNVGSSAHLRARRVAAATLESPRSDANLLAYAQSKLGLMQLSLRLRASLPRLVRSKNTGAEPRVTAQPISPPGPITGGARRRRVRDHERKTYRVLV